MPVSPYDWTLLDDTGGLSVALVDGLPGALPERAIGPGQTAGGRIGFIVPRAASGLRLRFDAELGDASAQVPLT